jgi:autotransporter-associated beta strand protein
MKTTQSLSRKGQTTSENRPLLRSCATWPVALCSAYLLACTYVWAQQSTVTWNNPAGGDWNTATNWNPATVPGIAALANISGNSAPVTYNSPMAAPSINGVSISTELDINAAGFNIDGSVPDNSGNSYNVAPFFVNAGTFNVNAGGFLRATNCGFADVQGTMNVGGTVVLDNCGTNTVGGVTAAIRIGSGTVGPVLNVTNGLFETTNSAPMFLNFGSLNVNGGNVLLLPNSGNSLLCLNSPINIANGSVTGNRAMLISAAGTRLVVGNNGSLNVTNGNLAITTNATALLSAGGTISAGGTLSVGASGGVGFLTNNGGSIEVNGFTVNNSTVSITCLALINGGTNDLGNVIVQRSGNSGGFPTLGTEGLVISNGLVRMTNLNVGNFGGGNNYLTMQLANGIVTNTGGFFVGQITSGRGARFVQMGGLMVNNGPTPVQLGQTNIGNIAIYSVTGGTNFVPGFIIGGVQTNASGSATVNITNAGTIVVGSSGMVTNWLPTLNFMLNNGGSFYASADWTGTAPMTLGAGSFTFNAGDLSGTPHNITISHRIGGSGTLSKAGPGTLTLNFTNTYTGSTMVNNGVLGIGANGSVASSGLIQLASGTTYDVTASASGAGGGTNLVNGQKLSGNGAVVGGLNANTGSSVVPGGSGVAGTLTFDNSLTESGGVINNFDLSINPSGNNDFINILGDLDLSGANTIQVNELNGPLPVGGVYTLIHYGGNLNGGVSNFTVAGAVATLSNNASLGTISLIIQGTLRGPTNTVWVGNALNNNWDNTTTSTNWLAGTSLSAFVSGDSVRFDATGQAHPIVNLVGSVNPSNTVVDVAAPYTLTGSGSLDGVGGLTKTNSGTLTIITTNNYPGPTVIGGGVLEVSKISASGTAGGIGSVPNSSPTNLVLIDSTLRYIGSNNVSTDRGVTLSDIEGTIDVANTNSLTMSGTNAGPGGLNKIGQGTLILSGVGSYSGVTTLSNGTLQVNNAVSAVGSNSLTFAGGTFALGSSLGSQPNVPNGLNILTTGGLTINGINSIWSGPWSGSGTLNVQVATNGFFTINTSIDSSFSGTVSMGTSGGPLRFNSGGNDTSAQQCTGSTNATFDLGTGTSTLLNRNGGGTTFGVYFLGALTGGPGTFLGGSGNAGSSSTYVIGDKGLSTTFAGTIQNGTAGSTNQTPQAAASVLIVKNGPGTFTLTGTNVQNGSVTITAGTLALSGGGSISRVPLIDVNAGAFLDVSGRTDGTLTLSSNQVLSGEGLVRGSVVVCNGATVSPGENPNVTPAGSGTFGVMTITNNLVVQSGGTLVMDLDPNSGTNDTITGLNSVTYGGTLDVSHVATSGYTLTNTFKLFYANSYSGSFDAINPLTAGGQYGWDTSTLAVDGTLRIMPAKPRVNSVVISGGNLQISGVAGPSGGAFDVLTSNDLTPVGSWTVTTSGSFNSDGTFSFSVPIDGTNPHQYFRIRYTFTGN